MIASASPLLSSPPLASRPPPLLSARTRRRRYAPDGSVLLSLSACHAALIRVCCCGAAVLRGLSTNEGDVEEMLLQQPKKFVILCVNIEIFVRASFNSFFQLLIISSRSRGRPSPHCASSSTCPPQRRRRERCCCQTTKPYGSTSECPTFQPCIDVVLE